MTRERPRSTQAFAVDAAGSSSKPSARPSAAQCFSLGMSHTPVDGRIGAGDDQACPTTPS